MEEPVEFLSRKHIRLLNIAAWAKYLAWVVLVFYIFDAFGTYIQEANHFSLKEIQYLGFNEYLAQNPSYALGVILKVIGEFLKGIVYFLTLKGISLGLHMVVETDINYREQKGDVE